MPELIVGNKTIDCKLIIFDKDGTLVDYRFVDLELARVRSKSVEKIAGKEALGIWEKIMGVDMKSERIDCRGPLGTEPRRNEMMIAAAAFYLTGLQWDEAKQLAQKVYDDADESMKSPYGSVMLEGVIGTLNRLKSNGLKLAVASTDVHNRTVESFKTLGIASLFDAIVGPEDVTNGKPAPDMIFEILRRTGCKTNETVMIGDSMSDMKMGRNAEVKACIGVLTGITNKEELERIADLVIDSVAQLDSI